MKYIKNIMQTAIISIILLIIGIGIGRFAFPKNPINYPYPIVMKDTIKINTGRDTLWRLSIITTNIPPAIIINTFEQLDVKNIWNIYRIEYRGHAIDNGNVNLRIYKNKNDTITTKIEKFENVKSPFVIVATTNGIIVKGRRNYIPIWEKLYLDVNFDMINKTVDYFELGTKLKWNNISTGLYIKQDIYNSQRTFTAGIKFGINL